ncbi:MBL fold metallo-hydrolase [Natronomonas halophila]|uniref:MBL fold metallo-hydrolase n=1 Tax=Natronomonas halophila TaxID=2747817 RepID=UPI0015B722A8|nr:rhodanese-like domain-containing protein [Natronomonas halophila]QLD84312.1 MBL fold metallo-hydrolase [Natronomonas halophila]
MTRTAERAPGEISAERLKELLDGDRGFALLDTRPEADFEGWHIPAAERCGFKPGADLDVDLFQSKTGLERDDSVVVICAKGITSEHLAEELVTAGYEDVRHVEGGMRAWSAVYGAVDVETAGDATIVQMQRRAKGCLGYLVADPETGAAAAIDVSRHTEKYREVAEEREWDIERVLDTHIHADHISGGRKLADELDVPYHLGERVAERDVAFEYEPLARNDVVSVGDIDLKALFTPGHTSGMASYLVGDEAVLTGDTVFVDSVGRTELQFGDADAAAGAEMLYDSLHGTLLAEPDSVAVLPGHADPASDAFDPGSEVSTTVRHLRTNLALLDRDRESFVAHITDSVPEKPPNYEQVIAINRGQDAPEDDEEAIELELGPNRCAAE